MSHAERERRHKASLAQINAVQLVVGRGDRTRVDHEGTLLERARMLDAELCAHLATERGLVAFDRLLQLAAQPRTRSSDDLAEFIEAVWGGTALPLTSLRGLAPEVGDDMLAVLDAWRHARLNLVEQVDGGPARVVQVLRHCRGASL